jgi:hypothetical protein
MFRSEHRDFSVDASATQYSIYAYSDYRPDRFGHNQWRCLGQMDCAEKAVQQAKRLFQSQKFAKIEIKKKFFDIKKNCHLVSTFQVLERKKIQQKTLLYCLGVIVLAALGLFAIEIL